VLVFVFITMLFITLLYIYGGVLFIRPLPGLTTKVVLIARHKYNEMRCLGLTEYR